MAEIRCSVPDCPRPVKEIGAEHCEQHAQYYKRHTKVDAPKDFKQRGSGSLKLINDCNCCFTVISDAMLKKFQEKQSAAQREITISTLVLALRIGVSVAPPGKGNRRASAIMQVPLCSVDGC